MSNKAQVDIPSHRLKIFTAEDVSVFDFILPINKRKLPYNYLQIKNGCPNSSERTRTSLGLRAGPGSQSPPPSASSMVGWGAAGTVPDNGELGASLGLGWTEA